MSEVAFFHSRQNFVGKGGKCDRHACKVTDSNKEHFVNSLYIILCVSVEKAENMTASLQLGKMTVENRYSHVNL